MNELTDDEKSVRDTLRKIVALNVWKQAAGYNWALKPLNNAFPYFCSVMYPSDSKDQWAKILLLEGWQTLHDFVRLRADPDAGYYHSYMEMAQFQVLFLRTGDFAVWRIDPGYWPRTPSPQQMHLLARLLWEAYGVFLRLEGDPSLLVQFASNHALFARVEVKPNVWRDEPMPLLSPPPYKEEVTIPTELFNEAKALPIDKNLRVAIDLRIEPFSFTEEKNLPPQANYALTMVDLSTRQLVVDDICCANAAQGGIKEIWTSMPVQVLIRLVRLKRLPCEMYVVSGRVFRFLRGLILQLPIKLIKKEQVPELDELLRKREKENLCKMKELMKSGKSW